MYEPGISFTTKDIRSDKTIILARSPGTLAAVYALMTRVCQGLLENIVELSKLYICLKSFLCQCFSLSLLLISHQFWGLCYYKIVLIKRSVVITVHIFIMKSDLKR